MKVGFFFNLNEVGYLIIYWLELFLKFDMNKYVDIFV